jgi:UDP-GlcNAc:undecaprenyl-phosphate GlcNAc-1-phosphate transferase
VINYLSETIEPYLDYLPYFLIALVSTFLLTPIIGAFAKKLNLIDLSATKMRTLDSDLLKKINKSVALRGGAIAMAIPLLVISIAAFELDKQIIAIMISVVILTVSGVIDDKKRLGMWGQLIPQATAALIVIAAGVSIDRVQNPLGETISLRSLVLPFSIGEASYSIALPADIITFTWIILIIQGINWMFGICGLGEGISVIAFTAILFISIKLGSPVPAMMAAITAGSLLGFLPFTISPAKIISGSGGSNVLGFLVAILSIIGGAKVSVTIIVLMIPILDMIWVMIGRINRHEATNLLEVIKATTTGDHTHLHHRLLKLNLSIKQIYLIEWSAVGVCAILAFATADLPKVTTITIVAVFTLAIFLGITFLIKRGVKLRKKKELPKREPPDSRPDDTPESRYAY